MWTGTELSHLSDNDLSDEETSKLCTRILYGDAHKGIWIRLSLRGEDDGVVTEDEGTSACARINIRIPEGDEMVKVPETFYLMRVVSDWGGGRNAR